MITWITVIVVAMTTIINIALFTLNIALFTQTPIVNYGEFLEIYFLDSNRPSREQKWLPNFYVDDVITFFFKTRH